MEPPIAGLSLRPFGDEIMAGAWIGCVAFAIGNMDAIREFKADSGIDLLTFANRGTMMEQVDKATGYERFVLLKFCDFVTEKMWGVEGAPKSISEEGD